MGNCAFVSSNGSTVRGCLFVEGASLSSPRPSAICLSTIASLLYHSLFPLFFLLLSLLLFSSLPHLPFFDFEQVRDDVTNILMVRFYRYLLGPARGDVALALQQTMVSMFKKEGALRHRFRVRHWAAFVAYGLVPSPSYGDSSNVVSVDTLSSSFTGCNEMSTEGGGAQGVVSKDTKADAPSSFVPLPWCDTEQTVAAGVSLASISDCMFDHWSVGDVADFLEHMATEADAERSVPNAKTSNTGSCSDAEAFRRYRTVAERQKVDGRKLRNLFHHGLFWSLVPNERHQEKVVQYLGKSSSYASK